MTNQQLARYSKIAQKHGIRSKEAIAFEKEHQSDVVLQRRIQNLKKSYRNQKRS